MIFAWLGSNQPGTLGYQNFKQHNLSCQNQQEWPLPLEWGHGTIPHGRRFLQSLNRVNTCRLNFCWSQLSTMLNLTEGRAAIQPAAGPVDEDPMWPCVHHGTTRSQWCRFQGLSPVKPNTFNDPIQATKLHKMPWVSVSTARSIEIYLEFTWSILVGPETQPE